LPFPGRSACGGCLCYHCPALRQMQDRALHLSELLYNERLSGCGNASVSERILADDPSGDENQVKARG